MNLFSAFFVRLLPFALAAFATACGPGGGEKGSDAADRGPGPLVIALKPDKDPEKMLAERSRLSEHLSRVLGRPVEAITPLNASVILEGFANGTVDLGYLSATDMLAAREAGVARVLLVGEIKGKREYSSYWVALADSKCSSVEDLRGKPVAFASRTSTSGYMVPHADLIRRGLVAQGGRLEDFFGEGNVWFGTGYVSAVQQVLNGDAEAAAVSDYVLDEGRHLSLEERSKLRKIAEQGPVPTHVLAVRKSLSPREADALRAAILEMEATEPELCAQVFNGKLVEADETAHLAPLEESLRLIGTKR